MRPLPPTFRAMTLADAIRAAAGREPGKVAMIEGERTRSFGDLSYRIDALCDAAITILGVARGDNVGIVARNCMEFIEVVAALPAAGAAVATINPRLAPDEIGATIVDCGASIIFVDSGSRASVEACGVDGLRLIEIETDYEALID